MTSSDREILIEIAGRVTKIEQGLSETRSEIADVHSDIANIHSDIAGIRAEMKVLAQEQEIIRHDIDHLQTSVYWGFAVLIFAVAYVPIHLNLRNSAKEPSVPPAVHVYAYPAPVQTEQAAVSGQKGGVKA